jgi:Concanavalin A-like lectin/glucanases superfamily
VTPRDDDARLGCNENRLPTLLAQVVHHPRRDQGERKSAGSASLPLIFWTRPTTDPDANRFNLNINPGGELRGDYREPNGTIHAVSAGLVLVNQWHHVAIVKDTTRGAPGRTLLRRLYHGVQTGTTFDPNPNKPDPDLMWTIAGRLGFQFTDLIDEIRLTQRALRPEEFLIASPGPTPTPGPCVNPPPNMVGWWPGDGNANDIVGGNNGTLQGGTTFASGEVGQAFSFDGTGYVDASDSNLPVGNSSATIAAWINTTQQGEHYFVSWDSRIGNCGPVANEIALGVFTDNHLIFESCSGNVRSSTIVNDGVWHHVVGVWYGSNMAAVYVDGVDVTVNDCSSGCLPTINIISSGHLNIGQFVQASGYNFSGLVDEVQVFNRALSVSEIQAMFAAGSAGE